MSLAVFLVLRHRKSSLAFVQQIEQQSAQAAAQADADTADRARLAAMVKAPPAPKLALASNRRETAPIVGAERLGKERKGTKGNAGVEHIAGVNVRSRRWRVRAHLGGTSRQHVLKGFLLWIVGIALLVLNWAWLQVLTVAYMKFATTPSMITLGTGIFNFSQMFSQFVVVSVMKKAEMQRVGAKHTNFDRFVLTNQVRWAFICYKAIFQAALLVRLSDWHDFLAYWITSAVTSAIVYTLSMSRNMHALIGTDIACCRRPTMQLMLRGVLDSDLLHQRGNLCFGEFLRHWGSLIAYTQHVLFIGYIVTFGRDNQAIFIPYSTAAAFDFKLQMQFCAVGSVLDWLQYFVTNILAKLLFRITPMYVGSCHLRQYAEFRRSMVMISMHIVSDVYIGMVFAMSAGIYMVQE